MCWGKVRIGGKNYRNAEQKHCIVSLICGWKLSLRQAVKNFDEGMRDSASDCSGDSYRYKENGDTGYPGWSGGRPALTVQASSSINASVRIALQASVQD